MMEEPSASSTKKRKLFSSVHACCFCNKSFDSPETCIWLDVNKIDSLLCVCNNNKDETAKYILANEYQIKNGEIELCYHKTCRSKFMHPFYHDENENEIEHKSPFYTRSKSSNEEFDWKKNCFICGQKCHPQKRSAWSMVETAVDKASKLYAQVLKAAELRDDKDVISRLVHVNGDLVAAEARYHRKKGCLSHYISERNIKALQSTPKKCELTTACEILKEEYKSTIEDQLCVYELSSLKKRFLEIADENNIPVVEKLRNRSFKKLLNQSWSNLRFISRVGITDLVCSENVSVDEALKRTVELENSFKEQTESTYEHLTESNTETNDELSILHKAASILRNKVLKTEKLDKEYFSATEITIEAQKQFLDPILIRFVGWLSSNSKLNAASDTFDSGDTDIDQRTTAIASDITALIANVVTPKHLGLTVHLHHTFGSKKLIEDLAVLGHTVSYSELRHFLTSAAIHMSSSQIKTPSGGIVPQHLQLNPEDKTLIVAAGDNWDHNEHTYSGKKSTHAMTSILVAPKSEMSHTLRIPRVQERSIDMSVLTEKGLSHVLSYTKPTTRPQPLMNPPVSLDELKGAEPEAAKILRLKELMYNIGRTDIFCEDVSEQVPPWTVYHSIFEPDRLQHPSDIVFNPIIMSPPNDYNTVYTTLKRTKEQINALGQHICPIFFDMGLLSKALEVVWARKQELDGVFPVEGGMHFLMSLFAGIGYLYGDMGLKNLLFESDVFAKGTAEHILSGKDFDRALRAIIMIDEVLHRRFFKQFEMWVSKCSVVVPSDWPKKIEEFKASLGSENELSIETVKMLESEIIPLIDQFRYEGRDSSPLFQFWDDYLTQVSAPMKLYISSSRHAIWDVHQYAKLKLLPFFFASNRTVYSRYMSYMVLNMNRLPKEALDGFNSGLFVAKLTNGSFNSVWIDYVLEVTENKALKSSGGIIGLTHQDNALARWFLSRPVTAEYSMTYKGNMHQNHTQSKHHTDTAYYKKAFNSDTAKMVEIFDDTFIDPFSLSNAPTKLVNFATGIEAPTDVQDSLLNCHERGQALMEKFVSERFVVQDGHTKPIKSFFDPLSKSKVKTMKDVKSSINLKSKDIPINGEEMYIRLLAINSFKKVSLERVMSFENAPMPLSLFSDDGKMISNKKSDFMGKIEGLIMPDMILKNVDGVDSIIFDAMAIVQTIQPPPSPIVSTYNDMALIFWKYVFNNSKSIESIHVVFDRYDENSLKSQTREKRGELLNTHALSHIQGHMKIGDWKKVLVSTKSKGEVTALFTKYIAEHANDFLSDSQHLYVSGGLKEKALKIDRACVSFVSQLHSNQEEADTKMLLHARFIANLGARKMVIVSPDTDVLVLLLHHFGSLGVHEVYLKTGRRSTHSDLTRYIPVHEVVKKLTLSQLEILLTVYCLTGCDTCSSFFGIGKKKVFKIIMNTGTANELHILANIGKSNVPSKEELKACIYFVGLLYGATHCDSLNKLRVDKVLKIKRVKPRKLPPTDDSFSLHLLRCIYQLLIWKGCLTAMLDMPDPTEFGYMVDTDTGLYRPHVMSQSVAPPELLSDLVCECSDFCNEDCVCSANEQPCTHACECKGCVDDVDDICKNIFTILAQVTSDTNSEFEW